MKVIKKVDLFDVLNKTNISTPIKIKRFGDVLIVGIVRIDRFNKVWARNQFDTEDTLIYPSKNVKILRIGNLNVQDDVSYQKELKDAKEFHKHLRYEEKMKLLKDAYAHNLRYPNVD